MAVAPHRRCIPTSNRRFRYCLWVWVAIVLSTLKAMREASLQDKAVSSHTFILYMAFFGELGGTKLNSNEKE